MTIVAACPSAQVLSEVARALVDELSRSGSETAQMAITKSLVEIGPAVLPVVVAGLFKTTSTPQFVALCVAIGKISPMLARTERTSLLLQLISLVGRTPDMETTQALDWAMTATR
jgi:hypothetical protein